MTQERHGKASTAKSRRFPGKDSSKIASAACLLALKRSRGVVAAASELDRLVSTIAKDSINGRVRADLYEKFKARILVDLAGQFRTQPVNSKQLRTLLGTPGMVTGKVAMLSDEDVGEDVATVIVGLAGAKAGATAAAGMVAPTIAAGTTTTMLGVGSGSVTGAAAGAGLAGAGLLAGVAVAGAGGYLVGSAINNLIEAAAPSYQGQDTYTLGDAIFDFFDDEDEDPAAAADDGQSGGAGEAEPGEEDDAAGEGDEDSGGDEDGEDDDGDDDGGEDDDGDDSGEDDADDGDTSDDDEGSDDDSDDDNGGSSTEGTPNPEAETGSPIDAFLFYAATGLGRGEIQRQLNGFAIAAGGALGVNREKATDIHWDRMLGGMYLRGILRGLEAQRNKAGLRDPVNTIVVLPDWRVFINGFICPSPLTDLVRVNEIAAVAE